ncbi:MAG: hypothetical protein ACYC1S_00780 [Gemmatimonadaceae bacterium]
MTRGLTRTRHRSGATALVSSLALLVAACGRGAAPGAAPAAVPERTPASPARTAAAQADTTALVPAGYGTLRQDDISIRLELEQVQVRLLPLDEGIIRLVSPDSYRALRDLTASRQRQVERVAQMHGLRERRLWYVSFYGLAPEAQFSPLELTITSGGREFRPLEVIALSSGFGEQRLQPRETQSAIYVFDDGMDLTQPLAVLFGRARDDATWAEVLRRIERERSLVRARAGRR